MYRESCILPSTSIEHEKTIDTATETIWYLIQKQTADYGEETSLEDVLADVTVEEQTLE